MTKEKLNTLLFILLVINFATIGFLAYQNYLLKQEKLGLESQSWEKELNLIAGQNELKKLVHSVKAEFQETKDELEKTEQQRDNFEVRYILERERMNLFDSKLQDIEGLVGTLEKLSQTDQELLRKYSKVYFLSENYVPESLTKIDTEYTYDADKDYLFYTKILPFLQNLMSDAYGQGIDIKIISAYRSFGEQWTLKSSYEMIYGSGANAFSADQGYSEHQLGTTVDFTTSEIGASYSDFENTEAYQWLLNNAYKYGFVISYPEENSYYQFEPWHWRFVGRTLAEKLHEEQRYFYDMEQREINQYLIFFFN